MRQLSYTVVLLLVFALAWPAAAVSPGRDLWVPAAAKAAGVGTSAWVTSLYVYNPGQQSVAVDLYWLTRNQGNLDAVPASYTLAPQETLRLDDAVGELVGLAEATGAIRIMASREVLAWARIDNRLAAGAYGQGLEAVPVQAATAADGWTEIIGLAHGSAVRTNIGLVETSGMGAEVELILLDDAGEQLAAATVELEPYEPILTPVTSLGIAEFTSGTLRVHVLSGAVIALGSRVEQTTNDPVTLSSSWRAAGASEASGTYYGAMMDVMQPGGVILQMDDDCQVTSLVFTYPSNKIGCNYPFPAGGQFTNPIPLEDLLAEGGVRWTQGYVFDEGTEGEISWIVAIERFVGNAYLQGRISGAGTGWTGWAAGVCDGAFAAVPMHLSKPAVD